MPTLRLETTRLMLVAATPELARAAVSDHASLAALLGAAVPPDWPPWVLADVQDMFATRLSEHPEQVGWWGWYILARPGVAGPGATLIGSVGAFPPDAEGRTMAGYSVLPAFEGRGFATEASAAVFDWVLSQPSTRVMEATTFERHFASRRILEKLGFVFQGISPDDAGAADSDRQGRGRLVLYRRVRGS